MKNNVLRDMSVDDLNQRYSNSLIVYNDKLCSCDGFGTVESGKKKIISIGGFTEFFDWEKLDVKRFRSGYYLYNRTQPVYFAYRPDRQYTRGYKQATTYLYSPTGKITFSSKVLDDIFKQQSSPIIKQKPRLAFDIYNVVKKRPYFPSEHTCVVSNGIWYRNERIATLLDDEEIFLDVPIFKQEVEEIILNPKFVDKINYIKQYKDMYRNPRFIAAWNTGNIKREKSFDHHDENQFWNENIHDFIVATYEAWLATSNEPVRAVGPANPITVTMKFNHNCYYVSAHVWNGMIEFVYWTNQARVILPDAKES